MLFALLAVSLQSRPDTLTLKIDAVERTALVFAPSVANTHPPVVFAFHGHMGNSRQASQSYQIQKEWPEAVVVYPQGLPTPTPLIDPQGRFPGWDMEGVETNRDIRFFDGLYREVMRRFHADPKHVFAMGHSNGGGFIYTLWATRPDKFAGFASAEAAGARRFSLQPKPIFVTIGSQDRLVPPALQRRSFDVVLKVNQAATTTTPFGPKGTLYKGKTPTVLWQYEGGHVFPRDSVPSMVAFFKSLM